MCRWWWQTRSLISCLYLQVSWGHRVLSLTARLLLSSRLNPKFSPRGIAAFFLLLVQQASSLLVSQKRLMSGGTCYYNLAWIQHYSTGLIREIWVCQVCSGILDIFDNTQAWYKHKGGFCAFVWKQQTYFSDYLTKWVYSTLLPLGWPPRFILLPKEGSPLFFVIVCLSVFLFCHSIYRWTKSFTVNLVPPNYMVLNTVV